MDMLWPFCLLKYHGPWCAARHQPEYWELVWAERNRVEVLIELRTYRPKQCRLPKHGPWCAHDLHPPTKTTLNPLTHFNLTPGRSRTEGNGEGDCSRIVNSPLIEEIQALNAIYGPGTLQVLGEKDGKTRLRLELPIGECAVFWVGCSPDYPHSIPTIQQAELSLHQMTDRRTQNIFLILFAVLNIVFVPGHVCLFDSIDTALPIIACLRDHFFDENLAHESHFDIDPQRWQWTKKAFVDMKSALTMTDCVICCDDYFAFEMIPVPCKHYFCLDCFETGWDVAFEESESFTCCLHQIPLETVKTFLFVSNEQDHRYKRLLKEKSMSNPFFCGWANCGNLIGSFSEWDLSRGRAKRKGIWCQLCRRYTCVGCRERHHPGACVVDDGLERFMAKGGGTILLCPTCEMATEKNGGCRHMTCSNCGSHWSWYGRDEPEVHHRHRHRPQPRPPEEGEEFFDDEGNAFRMEAAPVLDSAEAARVLQRVEMLRLAQREETDQLGDGGVEQEVVEQEMEGDAPD